MSSKYYSYIYVNHRGIRFQSCIFCFLSDDDMCRVRDRLRVIADKSMDLYSEDINQRGRRYVVWIDLNTETFYRREGID